MERLQKTPREHIDELELKCCCSARPLFECQFCTAHGSPMCLGTGSFAKIYRACWLGTTVAVKHYSAPGKYALWISWLARLVMRVMCCVCM